MYQGRYANRTNTTGKAKKPARPRKLNKAFLVILCTVLLLGVVGGSTLALLIADNKEVTNTFVAAYVSCRVNEDDTVTNTGNVDAFIRAAVVVNWMDGDGNIYGRAPEYTVTVNSGWAEKGNYYYYTPEVDPNQTTATAPVTVKVTSSNPGYTAVIEVVAEAIQAEGVKDGTTTKAYEDAWENTGTGN